MFFYIYLFNGYLFITQKKYNVKYYKAPKLKPDYVKTRNLHYKNVSLGKFYLLYLIHTF